MRYFAVLTVIGFIAAEPAFAQETPNLDRPDPGIGQPFEDAMIRKFEDAFAVNEAEAKCLVYEVMTYERSSGNYQDAPIEAAHKVAPRCGLTLKM